MRRLGISILLCWLMSGCASQAQTKVAEPAKPKQPPYTIGQAGTNSEGCGNTTQDAFGLYSQGNLKLDGQSLKLFTNRQETQQKSFCQILKESGRKVMIIQFAGVACDSCRVEAIDLQNKIRNGNFNSSILHLLVMTDLLVDFPDEQRFIDFKNRYASDATLAYDEAALWKAFSKEPAYPDRATILAMNLNMDAVLLNEEGQAYRIFDEAVRLIK